MTKGKTNGEGPSITSANTSIQQGNSKNNRKKLSIKDSDGNEHTKEQREYFKNSKVRDEAGKLKVMYHESGNTGFNVFDENYSDDGRSFFFADNIEVAKGYSGTYDIFSRKFFANQDELQQYISDEMGEDVEIRYNDKEKMYELWQGDEFLFREDSIDDMYWLFK